MSRSKWQPKRWFRRRSREGIIGLTLLAVCLLFDLFLLEPAHTKLDNLRQNIALAKSQANQPARLQDPGMIAAQQLSHYYSYFPPQSSEPDSLNKIFQAASAQTIQLIEGEYQAKRSENGKIVHYHITMPLKGTYSQIRQFIAEVLTKVPNASLDHISFERQKIEDPVIEAKVTFTLYMVAS